MVPLPLRMSCVGAEGVGARGRVLNYVCVRVPEECERAAHCTVRDK